MEPCLRIVAGSGNFSFQGFVVKFTLIETVFWLEAISYCLRLGMLDLEPRPQPLGVDPSEFGDNTCDALRSCNQC